MAPTTGSHTHDSPVISRITLDKAPVLNQNAFRFRKTCVRELKALGAVLKYGVDRAFVRNPPIFPFVGCATIVGGDHVQMLVGSNADRADLSVSRSRLSNYLGSRRTADNPLHFLACCPLLPAKNINARAARLLELEQKAANLNSHLKSAAAASAADFACVPLWKRVLDICFLLIAVPSLLPVLLMVAIAIKVGSKGPVLFKQERVGLLGKRFIIFKFRTMIAGADTAVHEKHAAGLIESNRPMTKLDAHGDARLTPFGLRLRAAGLDELPQLINVLRGEMSFVGPRPCLSSEYNRYLPWQRERFCTLPGLTGLWQVSGKNRTTFNEMIDLDIQYVRKQSLWLDLKIILKTIPAVIVQVRDTQSPATPTTSSHSTDQTPRD